MSFWESSNATLFDDPEIVNALEEMASLPPSEVALKLSGTDLPRSFIVNQIQGLQVAQRKFPFLLNYGRIGFPLKVNLEQSSSEQTARFKAQRFFQGKNVVDGTAGFGIDSLVAAQHAQQVLSVESSETLVELLKYNSSVLGLTNHEVLQGNFDINGIPEETNIVYLDPDRRATNQRSAALEDSTPDVVGNWESWMDSGKEFLIKVSPLVDISSCIAQLDNIVEVHVVSVNKEVKELLLYAAPGFIGEPAIHACELVDQMWNFSFTQSEETEAECEFGPLDAFLYIPPAGLMKAGAFKLFGIRHGLTKLHAHTHLYTSSERRIAPGRCYQILDQANLKTNEIAPLIEQYGKQFNIITKNVGLKPAEVAQQFKLKEGGTLTLIAFKDTNDQRRVAIAKPIY